jgi:5-methylcytosine-specific restriction endonuclease McrA
MSKHSARGPEWDALRLAVLERDNYTCMHCGRPATEADHVIPRSKGGRDVMENLVASCKRCNATRGDRELVRISGFNPRWLDGLG